VKGLHVERHDLDHISIGEVFDGSRDQTQVDTVLVDQRQSLISTGGGDEAYVEVPVFAVKGELFEKVFSARADGPVSDSDYPARVRLLVGVVEKARSEQEENENSESD
jgi:hypothetical protein